MAKIRYSHITKDSSLFPKADEFFLRHVCSALYPESPTDSLKIETCDGFGSCGQSGIHNIVHDAGILAEASLLEFEYNIVGCGTFENKFCVQFRTFERSKCFYIYFVSMDRIFTFSSIAHTIFTQQQLHPSTGVRPQSWPSAASEPPRYKKNYL